MATDKRNYVQMIIWFMLSAFCPRLEPKLIGNYLGIARFDVVGNLCGNSVVWNGGIIKGPLVIVIYELMKTDRMCVGPCLKVYKNLGLCYIVNKQKGSSCM